MNFHEHLEEDGLHQGPSNRNFGYTVGCVLLLIAAYTMYKTGPGWFIYVAAGTASVLVTLATVAPGLLAVPNRLWMGLGHLLFRVVNPVIMVLMYAVCFIPVGLVLRLVGHDPLKRRFDATAASYWVEKEAAESDQPMKNQF